MHIQCHASAHIQPRKAPHRHQPTTNNRSKTSPPSRLIATHKKRSRLIASTHDALSLSIVSPGRSEEKKTSFMLRRQFPSGFDCLTRRTVRPDLRGCARPTALGISDHLAAAPSNRSILFRSIYFFFELKGHNEKKPIFSSIYTTGWT